MRLVSRLERIYSCQFSVRQIIVELRSLSHCSTDYYVSSLHVQISTCTILLEWSPLIGRIRRVHHVINPDALSNALAVLNSALRTT